MSMLFSGSRDFIGEIDGVSYYIDNDGSYLRDDGFSMDGIDVNDLPDILKPPK